MSSTTSSRGRRSDATASRATTASKSRSFACAGSPAGSGCVPSESCGKSCASSRRAGPSSSPTAADVLRREVVADRLDERQVRERELCLAATPPEDGAAELASAPSKLCDQPCLADACVAGDHDEAALASVRRQQRVLEHGELFVASDENRAENALDHAADCVGQALARRGVGAGRRSRRRDRHGGCGAAPPTAAYPDRKSEAGEGRWGREDSNLRRLSRRFYRPLPLAARAHPREAQSSRARLKRTPS